MSLDELKKTLYILTDHDLQKVRGGKMKSVGQIIKDANDKDRV
jgi:hypothetical protein